MQINNKLHKTFALSAISLFMSGCAGVQVVDDSKEAARDSLKEAQRLKQQSDTLTSKHTTSVVKDEFYLVDKPYELTDRQRLPSLFKDNYMFNQTTQVSLREIVDDITKTKGVRIEFTNDALKYINGDDISRTNGESEESITKKQGDIAPVGDIGLNGESAPGIPGLTEPVYNSGRGNSGISASEFKIFKNTNFAGEGARLTKEKFTFGHNGTLESALDYITQKYAVSWKYENDQIVIFRTEFKTYIFDGTNTSTEQSSTMSTSAQGDAGSSGLSASTTMKTNLMYSEIQSTIEGMLTKGVGVMTMNSNTGAITVDDVPAVHAKAKKYIDKMNALVNKRIYFNAEIVEITSDDEGNYGVNLDALYKGSSLSFDFNPIAATATGNLDFGLTDPSSKWSGSSALVSMLREINDTVTSRKFSFQTQNGQSVPFQAVNRIAYMKSLSVTKETDDNGKESSKSDMDIAEVLPGFSINVTPKVTSRNDLGIQVSVNLNTLNDITEFSADSGASVAQLPDQTQQTFSQYIKIKNGQTMMLAGYEQVKNESKVKSLGDEEAWVAGGSKSGGKTSKMTVIFLTPYIMSN